MSIAEKDGLDIPPEVAEKLGYYVYLYVDPRTDKVRYIGKGTGARAIEHLYDRQESAKVKWLAELRRLKLKPRIEVLARNLASDEEALRVERCAIDIIGIENLTNVVRGHDAEHGRELLSEIILREGAEDAVIRHSVLMFRVTDEYFKPGEMSEEEIYEINRRCWVVGKQGRSRAQYAFLVYKGLVRKVFCIDGWEQNFKYPGRQRWNFSSTSKVPAAVMRQYLHKSVRGYLKKVLRSPVIYEEGSDMPEEITIRKNARKAVIRHPVLMFHINKHHWRRMNGTSEKEIYDNSRFRWVIGNERREKAQYALIVYEGVVRGVFSMDGWERDFKYPGLPRWNFSSTRRVPAAVMEQYLHKSVREHFMKDGRWLRNPVIYVDGAGK